MTAYQYQYQWCELTLGSDVELPELRRASDQPLVHHDWRIRMHRGRAPRRTGRQWFHHWRFPDGRRWLSLARADGGYLVRFPSLADFDVQPVPGVPGLFLLPVGNTPPNPLELVERPAFGLLMREFTTRFDYVVVDTPAAEYGADATVIADQCGAALMLARRDVSRIAAVEEMAISLLDDGHPKLTGVVFNHHRS